jgi:two-component system, LuxR family, sensor kinase FixL
MNTLLIGDNSESVHILEQALKIRRHDITISTVSKLDPDEVASNNYSLIVLCECTPGSLKMCRKIKAADNHDSLVIITILNQNSIDKFNEVLESGVDQCIVESLYDEKRLDIRLAFAEKLARDKIQRNIIEEKLRESEARYRSIVETTVDSIITINDKAIIRTFNKAAEKLFQYKANEVIGQNVKMLMPNPYRKEHDDYMHNYLSTGQRKIIGIGREVTGLRKDGSTFPMYLAVSEVKLRDQRIFTGIIRDISEQRRLESEVLRTSEYERRRIGQDLHDGLGQMLTGIGLISKHVAQNLKKEGHSLAEHSQEITDLIKEADQYARELARGLVPVELDGEGLTTALDRLTTHAEKLFGIKCDLVSKGKLKLEDATHVMHLYRITQEAINNAVKHGDASEVSIRLVVSKSHTRLMIEDNGTGFQEDWDKKGGLGVRIMQFRAGLIGSNLEISDSPKGGARVTCTIPIIGE